ncbi:hypothetical protein Deipr_2703 (plasmid) [Deinococcus proteolyticus MRP]|uniref:Transcriptional regulator n=1 Tax=Deinococcus proteolyticus (strain ATCC 35074 / DSM 20540 / JCM 6276 / NBRC 101906 / NCIMB 13154 / VKM Ac-1939 / CCM 2703 / MRP) TaxID=693977 RepID=F0RR94_DEIPM|nr:MULTISPECIES: DUF4160 domain-containing protein [Deinococcus]ADY27803.1 hypothetical protein Deipr_2703 [Deinococcus proteolyticus MRP]MCY1703671.1 DUF4160 domain-containing protein [Deinococcus sp. SL84]
MPELTRFFGIRITMYFSDHNPPHFHAEYGDDEAVFGIQELAVLEGQLSKRATRLVLEWAAMHQAELMEAWNAASNNEAPGKISPLE